MLNRSGHSSNGAADIICDAVGIGRPCNVQHGGARNIVSPGQYLGGRVEFGESLHTALHREVDEETGLRIQILELAGWREVLPGAGGGGHYLIMSFAARWTAREPVLNDEHDDFKWIDPDKLGDLKLTGGLVEVLAAARRLIRT